MSQRLQYDVVVIGGGIVGSSAALMLSKRGIKVGLFERNFCGAQASGVNYGGVRRQGRPAEQLPLAARARAIWDELPSLIGTDGEFIVSGHLRLARSENDLAALREYAAMAEKHDLKVEIVSGNAFRWRYPWLSDAVIGGSLSRSDGHANPRIVSPAFSRAARTAGTDVREKTEISSISAGSGGFLIEAKDNTGDVLNIEAGWVINAAGAWGTTVANWFNEPTAVRSYYPSLWVTEPMPHFLPLNLGMYGGGFYARQVERGNVVVSGGAGVGDADFGHPDMDRTRIAMRTAAQILPGLRHALILRTWSGVEGETPDRNPVLGPSMTTPRLLHGFGFSGGGFMIGPGAGAVLAEIVATGATTTPIEAFRIDRFH